MRCYHRLSVPENIYGSIYLTAGKYKAKMETELLPTGTKSLNDTLTEEALE